MRTVLEVGSYVAMIVAAAVVVWRVGFPAEPPGPPGQPPPVEDVSFILAAEDIRHVDGDGPIALVEFTDLECPFCQRYQAETYPQIKAQFIDTGQVRFVTMHFPLASHPGAVQAAMDVYGDSEARIEADVAVGRALGVMATPTFFVGRWQPEGAVVLERRINGAQPLAVFVSELNAAHTRSQQ